MDFGISIGIGGLAVLLVGAVVVGFGSYFIGEPSSPYEWFFIGVAAFLGAFVASEWIVGFRTVEPVWDGLALLPALAGGLVVGAVAFLAARFLAGGSITHHPMAA